MVVIGVMFVNLEVCLQWYFCVLFLLCDRYFDGIVLFCFYDVGSVEYLVFSCSFVVVVFVRNVIVVVIF